MIRIDGDCCRVFHGSSRCAAIAYVHGFALTIWYCCCIVGLKHLSDLAEVFVKFGMRTTPSTLVISDGCGHTSFSDTHKCIDGGIVPRL